MFSSVGKLLGYREPPHSHQDIAVRTPLHLQQLTFPGWQVFVGFEWFVNFRTRYRNIIDSDQYVHFFCGSNVCYY